MQAGILLRGGSASGADFRDRDLALAVVQLPGTLWPLLIGLLSIAQTNSVLANVPRTLTKRYVFTSEERSHFASDYGRWHMQLNVRLPLCGWEIALTTGRLMGAAASTFAAMLTAYTQSFFRNK